MSTRRAGGTSGPGSRERILQATGELAKERGVGGATIAAVSQRSGLPASSIYWHFEDKDALLAEVVRASFAQWLATVPRWDTPSRENINPALRAFLNVSIETLPDVPDFIGIGMQVLLDRRGEHAQTRAAFLALRAQALAMIAAYLKEALGPEVGATTATDLATLVVTFAEGMLVGSQIYADWSPHEYQDLFFATLDQAISLSTP